MTILTLAVLAAIPLLAVAVIIGMRAPLRLLLAAYAALVPFGSGVSLPVGLPSQLGTLSTFAGFFTAVAIVARLAVSPRRPARLLPVVPVWILFLALTGLTVMWSPDQETTTGQFLLLAAVMGLFLVVAVSPVEKRDVLAVELGIVLGGVVIGAYGVVALLQGGLQETAAGTPRLATAGGGATGQAGANITAASLLLPLAVAAGRALRATTLVSSRIAWFLAAAVVATGITMTGSRGALVACVPLVFVVMLSERRRKVALITGVMVLAVIGLVITALPEQTQSHLSKQSSSGRTDIWRVGLLACEKHCWVGSGWGTFEHVYNETLGLGPGSTGKNLHNKAHNIWVRTAVEAGFLGVILMTLALIMTAHEVLRLPPALRGPPLAGLVGVAFSNGFLSNIDFKYFWLAIIYCTLVVLAHESSERLRTSVA
jgi:O-antigen ligase